jgi:outer membrane receptor protein involved in Fe transport
LYLKKQILVAFSLFFACFFGFADELTNFEKAELKRLLELDLDKLADQPVQGVLGYDQAYWRNPASVHIIRPEDITEHGFANSVEALRAVPGMHVSRGLSYDNFAAMRNFSGFTPQKFLGKIGGREVSQLMLGSANYSVDDYPIAVIDRIEIVRGPGASIWGTNAVNGVINLVTKHSSGTQGDSVRFLLQDNGTFMGDYVHGGQISDDSYYRFWVRDQEYAEGTLNSGIPARDDGYLRKAGFRFDKELNSDLNFYIAGGGATRRLEHTLDLSNRLLYDLGSLPAVSQLQLKSLLGFDQSASLIPIPLSLVQGLRTAGIPSLATPAQVQALLPEPSLLSYNPLTWADIASGVVPFQDFSISRFEQYGDLTNDSGHVVAKLDGITDSELEWSLTGAVEHTEISLGHIGFDWDQTQFDLGFDANRPLGDFHRLSFGLAARRTDLDVRSTVIEPFAFSSLINPTYLVPPSNPFDPTSSSSSVPVLSYNQEFTEIDRFTAYIQDSISLTDKIEVSIGTKFEENDLAGTGFQPGVRASWLANDSNVLWAGYSKAHRQPSLRERYTTLTPAKVWIPNPLLPGGGIWSNIQFEGDESLDREEIDSFELGWRSRPRENLLLELSSYYYDTKNAVLASQTSVNAYEAKDAKSYGGELSIDWDVSSVWKLRGGYSLARGEIEGERNFDFPEQTASLTSRFAYSDDLTFTQSLYYADETQIPSDYNPISIPSHLRLDLGIIWEPRDGWEIGIFGRDLLEPYHIETMLPGIDVEPARVERTFLLSIYKKF